MILSTADSKVSLDINMFCLDINKYSAFMGGTAQVK